VIGSEFSYELLHAVHPIPEEDLQRALRNLADAELLYVRGITPEATYQFKYALIRDAAYEALLKSRRKDLHRLVARAIDEKFPALKEAHPEVLARRLLRPAGPNQRPRAVGANEHLQLSDPDPGLHRLLAGAGNLAGLKPARPCRRRSGPVPA
jgi:hypothetical protein